MVSENICPVCGYEMEEPAKDYNVCSSCGTEFGVSDVNSSVAELRDNWLESGPSWWSKTEPQPADWNPLEQMTKAGISPKKPAAKVAFTVSYETPAVTTRSSNTVIGVVNWVAGTPEIQPYGIPREVESQ